jgi:membrane protein required for colicin V production
MLVLSGVRHNLGYKTWSTFKNNCTFATQKTQIVNELCNSATIATCFTMWIDVCFLILFVYGFWQGWSQGIIGTIFNLAIYVFGIVLAYKMAPLMSTVLEKIFDSHHPVMFVAGFAANFLVIYVIVQMASGGIENLIHGAYLGVFNRALGGVFIAAFYVLLFSILLWFGSQAQVIDAATTSKSMTYEPLLKELPGRAKALVVRFKPLAFNIWDDSLKWMDTMEDYGVQKTESKAKVYELPVPGKDQQQPYETQPRNSNPVLRPSSDDGTGIER